MKAARPERVVDSSVVFKWFASEGEASVPEALELLAAHERAEIKLIAPALMPYEVLDALRYASLRPHELCEAAQDLMDLEVLLVAPDRELLDETARVALENDLTVYDAAFVGLARLRDCELVTADRKGLGAINACKVCLL